MLKQSEILQLNWNNLIILDCCRYDSLKHEIKKTNINKDVIPVNSEAINTPQWYKKHFSKPNDITLISPNLYIWYHKSHKVFEKAILIKDNWLKPEATLKEALKYEKKIIHLLCPHLPFMGAGGYKFLKRIGYTFPDKGELVKNNVTDLLTKYGREKGWGVPYKYYIEHLDYGLFKLEKYLPKFKGLTIITADHSELIGEYGLYGHNLEYKELKRVPCLIY